MRQHRILGGLQKARYDDRDEHRCRRYNRHQQNPIPPRWFAHPLKCTAHQATFVIPVFLHYARELQCFFPSHTFSFLVNRHFPSANQSE